MAADPQVTIPIPGLQAMSLRLSDSSSGTTRVNISNCPSDSDIQQVAGGSSFFQSNKMDVFLVLFNREMVFVAIFPENGQIKCTLAAVVEGRPLCLRSEILCWRLRDVFKQFHSVIST